MRFRDWLVLLIVGSAVFSGCGCGGPGDSCERDRSCILGLDCVNVPVPCEEPPCDITQECALPF